MRETESHPGTLVWVPKPAQGSLRYLSALLLNLKTLCFAQGALCPRPANTPSFLDLLTVKREARWPRAGQWVVGRSVRRRFWGNLWWEGAFVLYPCLLRLQAWEMGRGAAGEREAPGRLPEGAGCFTDWDKRVRTQTSVRHSSLQSVHETALLLAFWFTGAGQSLWALCCFRLRALSLSGEKVRFLALRRSCVYSSGWLTSSHVSETTWAPVTALRQEEMIFVTWQRRIILWFHRNSGAGGWERKKVPGEGKEQPEGEQKACPGIGKELKRRLGPLSGSCT